MPTIAVVLAAAVVCAPVSVHVTAKILKEAAWKVPAHTILIAQKYGGTDPAGDDPHGGDPHDENHDDNMPANDDRSFGKAPKDVYGGTFPNTQAPY